MSIPLRSRIRFPVPISYISSWKLIFPVALNTFIGEIESMIRMSNVMLH